jgi:hypothetical protein
MVIAHRGTKVVKLPTRNWLTDSSERICEKIFFPSSGNAFIAGVTKEMIVKERSD